MSQSQFLSQTQSQSQSQAGDPTWASVPLLKFSYATYQSTRPSPAWTHLQKDLKLEVQAYRSVDEQGILGRRVIMKFFSKDALLESQDLGQLVRISQNDPSLVVVVENCPRIAMRYFKDPDTVWKCEMKFSSDADFSIIINAMKDLGLPVQQHKPRVPVMPSPAPSVTPMISTTPVLPAGSLQILHARPSSTTSLQPVSSDLVRLPPVPSFKVPGRAPIAENPSQMPGASGSGPPSIPIQIQPETHLTSFREPANRLYMLQLERESRNRQLSQPMSQALSQEFKHDISSIQARQSAFLHQIKTQQTDDGEGSASRPRLLSRSPFFAAPQNTTAKSNGDSQDPFYTSEPHLSQIQSTFDNTVAPPRRELPFDRPSSTPTSFQNFTVPPRRDLPFNRPEPPSRTSSALDLPPLPKPTPVVTAKANQVTEPAKLPGSVRAAPVKRVAQRKAPISKESQGSTSRAVSPLKSLTHETTIEPPKMCEDAPSPLAKKSAAASRPASRSASAASGLVSKAIVPAKKRVATPILPLPSTKRPKMVSQSTQTLRMSGPDLTNKEIVPAVNNVPGRDPARPVATISESYLNDLDSFVASHMARPAPKELLQMPGYAEADTDRRHAMLNDFICQNLEDPDFLRLCADMDSAWRRIGLGL